jgi:membrane protein YdbS with pleckstrin-like domain
MPPPPPPGPPPPPPPAAAAAPPRSTEPPYPARLDIDYPEHLNRVTTAFRIVLVIPIGIVLGILTDSGTTTWEYDDGEWATKTGTSIVGALFLVTALMILFRQRYPRWWFDFARELSRFSARVTAYLTLVTDEYPSTVDEQRVHLEFDYPDVERDLNRWLPLVKWFLAIPHFVILAFLWICAVVAVIVAWFAIVFTGRYPRGVFDFVVGVGRWSLRVYAYAFLLITDRYPPFALD